LHVWASGLGEKWWDLFALFRAGNIDVELDAQSDDFGMQCSLNENIYL